MGKSGMQNKAYGKVVGKDAADRPGWKGPGYVKKPKPAPKKVEETVEIDQPEPQVPIELQQLLLNIFKDSFPDILGSENLTSTLQEIKGALYERDFTKAFGKDVFLEAYSIRWSPSRALCYQSILVDLQEHFRGLSSLYRRSRGNGALHKESSLNSTNATLRVVAFGGGAAEVVAFGGFVRLLQDAVSPQSSGHHSPPVPTSSGIASKIENLAKSKSISKVISETVASISVIDISRGSDSPAPASSSNQNSLGKILAPSNDVVSEEAPYVDLLLLDTASWGNVIQTLNNNLKTPPTLSKYASAAAREANTSMLADRNIVAAFKQENLLDLTLPQLGGLLGKEPTLMTLLFTLNELYTNSISKTTAFLMKITTVVKPGSILLVVDSPGSYSETTLGQESKKYPMKWLLDHTLLESSKLEGGKLGWEKVVSEDSKWFRIAEDLSYPISLENMRYQVHLYRRL